MTPAEILQFQLPLFADLTPEDFDGIRINATKVNLNAGQTLFDQDDQSFDLYFLLSGSMQALYWTTQGREIIYARLPIGAYFGELSALDAAPRSLSMIARTPASVLALGRASFLNIYRAVPAVNQRINTGLVTQIRLLTQKNMEVTTLSVEQRTIRYLFRLACDHDALKPGATITHAPTHAEIAGSIGANREMVSRTISKLSKSGVINSSRKKIVILNPAALRTAAGAT